MPISTRDLLGPSMVSRGAFIEGIYAQFTIALCRRSSEYVTHTGNRRTSMQTPRGVAPMSRQVTASDGPTVRRDIHGIQYLVDQDATGKHARPKEFGEPSDRRKRQILDRMSALATELNSWEEQPEPESRVEVWDETHMAGSGNRRASQPGQHGTPFLDRVAFSNPGSAAGPSQQGIGAGPRTTPQPASTAAPRQENPVQAPTTNEEPPAPGSNPQVIKDWLRQAHACYYFAYGLACPYEP